MQRSGSIGNSLTQRRNGFAAIQLRKQPLNILKQQLGLRAMSEPSIEEINHLADLAYRELIKKNYSKSRELFEELYQHAYIDASVYLGFLHSQKGTPEYNVDKALGYLQDAAAAENVRAMNYLGHLLDDIGRRNEAIEWALRASERGDGDSSRLAAWAYRQEGDFEKADNLLEVAASQGDASAIQIIAMRKLKGRDGSAGVGSGLIMLARNFLPLLRYIKERVYNFKAD